MGVKKGQNIVEKMQPLHDVSAKSLLEDCYVRVRAAKLEHELNRYSMGEMLSRAAFSKKTIDDINQQCLKEAFENDRLKRPSATEITNFVDAYHKTSAIPFTNSLDNDN